MRIQTRPVSQDGFWRLSLLRLIKGEALSFIYRIGYFWISGFSDCQVFYMETLPLIIRKPKQDLSQQLSMMVSAIGNTQRYEIICP